MLEKLIFGHALFWYTGFCFENPSRKFYRLKLDKKLKKSPSSKTVELSGVVDQKPVVPVLICSYFASVIGRVLC